MEAELLYQLAQGVAHGCIVEVGSYRGRSTVALALGAAAGDDPSVYAVDPHEPYIGTLGGIFGPEDRGEFFRSMLFTRCYRNVRLINLSSDVITAGWRDPVGLLWIDGDHSYEGVRRDWDCWHPNLLSEATVVFDDARPEDNLGPARMVQELVDAGEVKIEDVTGKVVALSLKGCANW